VKRQIPLSLLSRKGTQNSQICAETFGCAYRSRMGLVPSTGSRAARWGRSPQKSDTPSSVWGTSNTAQRPPATVRTGRPQGSSRPVRIMPTSYLCRSSGICAGSSRAMPRIVVSS
ncbi:50S ribosomal protein L17, partial [Dysosmobacter welbionis]